MRLWLSRYREAPRRSTLRAGEPAARLLGEGDFGRTPALGAALVAERVTGEATAVRLLRCGLAASSSGAALTIAAEGAEAARSAVVARPFVCACRCLRGEGGPARGVSAGKRGKTGAAAQMGGGWSRRTWRGRPCRLST